MSRKVLVVDDSQTMRDLLSLTLKEAGFQVVEGGNGKEGLDRLGAGKVDLIISDVNMPVMDGITFVQQLRTLPSSRCTPVLMLTTETAPGKKAAAKAAGATGWLVKPFTPEQSRSVIARVLP
jgi:two-component system, chemotaxis family, chemotaxis protein CheY